MTVSLRSCAVAISRATRAGNIIVDEVLCIVSPGVTTTARLLAQRYSASHRAARRQVAQLPERTLAPNLIGDRKGTNLTSSCRVAAREGFKPTRGDYALGDGTMLLLYGSRSKVVGEVGGQEPIEVFVTKYGNLIAANGSS